MYKNILFVVYLNTLNRSCDTSLNVDGWGYINLHCRDNNNVPVDWWYIYKPASDVVPFFELGRNFTFITPGSRGRWEPSDKYITSNSMLQHTLAPIFRPTYADYLAVAIYDKRDGNGDSAGSVARGVLLADEMGGVWIDHTVPNLVNLERDRPFFPEKESANGHLLMCLSLDLEAVNKIAHSLRKIYPKLTYLRIPAKVEHLLPEWNILEMPLFETTTNIQLVTRDKSLHVEMVSRRPGDKTSIYQKFASSKKIVLDVYGPTDSHQIRSICRDTYSVRNIDKISLKLQERVLYVVNKTDRMRFAVSSSWRNLDSEPKQYWSCISNLDREDSSGMGGDLVCVDNYKIWLTFANLKVSEPECT